MAAANTFELVAREFHKSKGDSWLPGYVAIPVDRERSFRQIVTGDSGLS